MRSASPRRSIVHALVLVLTAWVALTACSPVTNLANPKFTIHPSSEVPVTAIDLGFERGQNSPALASDPSEPRFLALASRIDGPKFDCALHLSGDGGKTWVPAKPIPKLPEGAERCYAPEVGVDSKGILYYAFLGLHTAGNTPMGAFITTSTNRGRTFGPPQRVLGPSRYMVRMAIDRQAQDRIHLLWLEPSSDPPTGGLPPTDNPLLSAYSDDAGATFSKPVRVSDPGRERVVAPALALGPSGEVHVAYYDLQDDARDYQGLAGPVWEGKWSIVVASSLNRGKSFRRQVQVTDDIRPPERVMLVITMPPPSLAVDPKSGRLYVSWWDARSGDWDVFISASEDGGARYRKPLRINDDRLKNRRHQYLPKLGVAPDGRVDALFYDRRDDPKNKNNHLYYAFSVDGAKRFAPNFRVTSEPSNTRTGARYPIASASGLNEFGSRTALLSESTRVFAAWTDTRLPPAGYVNQNIFSTRLNPRAEASPARWIFLLIPLIGAAALAIWLGRHRGRPGRALKEEPSQSFVDSVSAG